MFKFFTPEPFSPQQLASAMRNTLDMKIRMRKVKAVNSTAQAGDPLIYVTRDGNFFNVMNDYGHRAQTGVGAYRSMGERKFSESHKIIRYGTDPEIKKEKVYLTFQDRTTGPPQLDELGIPLLKWVDTFNSFKELREKARRNRQGGRRSISIQHSNGSEKVRDPMQRERRHRLPESKGAGRSYHYTSSTPPPKPPWETDDAWERWSAPGAYDVPRRDATPPPKARPQAPKAKPMPMPPPAEPPINLVEEAEWYTTAPPEGTIPACCSNV